MSAEIPAQFTARQAAGPGSRIDGWKAFWILTTLVGTMFFLRDLVNLDTGFAISGGAMWGRDFVNVYSSGALTLQGRLDLLYDVEAYRAYQVALFESPLRAHNYSYPPVTLLYTWAFALLPYPLAWMAWLGGTGALFVRAARPYLKGLGLPGWIAILAPASIINIWAGHYGFLIGALWLSAWSLLPRRPALAGALIGLMIVKPHLAILAPVVLLWRRQWVAFAVAATTVLGLVALSAALFGTGLWVTYVTETALLQAAMVDDVGAFFLTMMPTLTPALAILGIPVWLAATAQGLVGFAAIFFLLRRMPKDPGEAGLATATATFMVLPYAFAYDMTVVGLAGLILLRRALNQGGGMPILLASLCAFAPMAVTYLNVIFLPIVPLLIAWQLHALLPASRQYSGPPLRSTAGLA